MHRVALRAIPLFHGSFANESENANETAIAVFRANAVTRVALKYGGSEIVRANADAANAASTFGNIAARAAALAARAAYDGDGADTDAVSAAVLVARALGTDAFWSAVTIDARVLEQVGDPLRLRHSALWENGVPEFWRTQVGKTTSRLLSASLGWKTWLDWFKSISDGAPAFGLPTKIADDLEIRIAHGNWREGFWEREATEINAEIAGWVAEARTRQTNSRDGFSTKEQLRHWIDELPSERLRPVAQVVAARVSLRSMIYLVDLLAEQTGSDLAAKVQISMSLMRSNIALWVTCAYADERSFGICFSARSSIPPVTHFDITRAALAIPISKSATDYATYVWYSVSGALEAANGAERMDVGTQSIETAI